VYFCLFIHSHFSAFVVLLFPVAVSIGRVR
jgi:hypothetical protein